MVTFYLHFMYLLVFTIYQIVRNSFLFFLIYYQFGLTDSCLFNYTPLMYLCLCFPLSHTQITLDLACGNSLKLASLSFWHVLIMFWALHYFCHKNIPNHRRLIVYLCCQCQELAFTPFFSVENAISLIDFWSWHHGGPSCPPKTHLLLSVGNRIRTLGLIQNTNTLSLILIFFQDYEVDTRNESKEQNVMKYV